MENIEACADGDSVACDIVRQNDEGVAEVNSGATGQESPDGSNADAGTNSGTMGLLPNSANSDAGYCADRHPHYSAGQKIPLGMPIDLDLLQSQGATGRDLRIIRNTRAGLMADAYYCRRRLAFLRSEAACSSTANRPHRGVDVGMGRFFYQTPVFATADGVV
jgi:murein DD-endopeptidase MepM/ murein hydrolase activator NlpD